MTTGRMIYTEWPRNGDLCCIRIIFYMFWHNCNKL